MFLPSQDYQKVEELCQKVTGYLDSPIELTLKKSATQIVVSALITLATLVGLGFAIVQRDLQNLQITVRIGLVGAAGVGLTFWPNNS
jgi:hypothetical protein